MRIRCSVITNDGTQYHGLTIEQAENIVADLARYGVAAIIEMPAK